ncbi:MAG TPA: ABC transporter permease [Candidatus Saccharimonadales bacterium]|nr:ABC transporter permease [Candidatus Saccharimonadales bacterium]
MIPILKAEFRKLLTVRSTYFIVLASLVIVAFFAGFTEGIRGDAANLHRPDLLVSESTNAIVFVGLILAFAGMLLVGHEYRYNTIMYTLTATNRRYKVLLAKFVAISVFAVAASVLVTFFSPLCTIIGAHLAGKVIGPQTYPIWHTLWHCVFCGWGYAMYAFVLIAILRNQVGSIVTFLLFPLIGENILSLLLKNNTKYLPFNAVQAVANPTGLGNHTSTTQAALTVLAYVAAGLAISLFLFQKRDAN